MYRDPIVISPQTHAFITQTHISTHKHPQTSKLAGWWKWSLSHLYRRLLTGRRDSSKCSLFTVWEQLWWQILKRREKNNTQSLSQRIKFTCTLKNKTPIWKSNAYLVSIRILTTQMATPLCVWSAVDCSQRACFQSSTSQVSDRPDMIQFDQYSSQTRHVCLLQSSLA